MLGNLFDPDFGHVFERDFYREILCNFETERPISHRKLQSRFEHAYNQTIYLLISSI